MNIKKSNKILIKTDINFRIMKINKIDVLFVLILRRAARKERKKSKEVKMLLFARHPNEK